MARGPGLPGVSSPAATRSRQSRTVDRSTPKRRATAAIASPTLTTSTTLYRKSIEYAIVQASMPRELQRLL